MAFTKKDRLSLKEKITSLLTNGYRAQYNIGRLREVIDIDAAVGLWVDGLFNSPGYYKKWLEVRAINPDGVDPRVYVSFQIPAKHYPAGSLPPTTFTTTVSVQDASLVVPDLPWSARSKGMPDDSAVFSKEAIEFFTEVFYARTKLTDEINFARWLIDEDMNASCLKTVNQIAAVLPDMCTLLGGEYQRALAAGTKRTRLAPEFCTEETRRKVASLQSSVAYGALWSDDMLATMGAKVDVS